MFDYGVGSPIIIIAGAIVFNPELVLRKPKFGDYHTNTYISLCTAKCTSAELTTMAELFLNRLGMNQRIFWGYILISDKYLGK